MDLPGMGERNFVVINEPAISRNVRLHLFAYPPEATFYSFQNHWQHPNSSKLTGKIIMVSCSYLKTLHTFKANAGKLPCIILWYYMLLCLFPWVFNVYILPQYHLYCSILLLLCSREDDKLLLTVISINSEQSTEGSK